jgi:hypothetical protein
MHLPSPRLLSERMGGNPRIHPRIPGEDPGG